MKTAKTYLDLGAIFDEIFEAAQDFKDEFHRNFSRRNGFDAGEGPHFHGRNFFDENIDYYPAYSYPPMNVYLTADRGMVFEFALAGFDEGDLSLSFQGDYMVFSALGPSSGEAEAGDFPPEGTVRYLKRRLKMKNIEKQKYYVPLDKYAQDKVRAVYRNGILKVTVPPRDDPGQNDGVKIAIVKEGV
ncbi:MAG: Hsp20 family protein [Treponema sp.]|jgi:HSP20 family molecular chaperone IbpA|nr:Hsp20 family protein [Treponema sp.]